MKYTRPVNGVIKLYCYEEVPNKVNTSSEKINLKPSRHEVNNPEINVKTNENRENVNIIDKK